ncbi:MAG: hypothetical protein L6Q54_01255 [Leptospiraceae bacterium]|nr:hypothetical protein [Leptospiraceae bacterium]MCK6379867.1 hypothetical protein [Leptospiraceae bacterium]NUM42973.1 hypothetical protein [Leptospiraceae bacterium]
MESKKIEYINNRIPVVKEEVTPEVHWITFQLSAQIESDFLRIVEQCNQINSSISHFSGLMKSFNVRKFEGTDYQAHMEQVEMDIGAKLLKQCMDGIKEMSLCLEDAKKSIRKSVKTSRMHKIKITEHIKEIEDGNEEGVINFV